MFNKEELEVISHGLTLRESAMLRDADAYKAQKNLDAQMDCINEWKKTHKLSEKVRELVRDLK